MQVEGVVLAEEPGRVSGGGPHLALLLAVCRARRVQNSDPPPHQSTGAPTAEPSLDFQHLCCLLEL